MGFAHIPRSPSCLRFAPAITDAHARLVYRLHAFGLTGRPFTDYSFQNTRPNTEHFAETIETIFSG